MLVNFVEKKKLFNFEAEKNRFDFRWDYSREGLCYHIDLNYGKFLIDNFSFDPDVHEFDKGRFLC